jgi:hypothetical protein
MVTILFLTSATLPCVYSTPEASRKSIKKYVNKLGDEAHDIFAAAESKTGLLRDAHKAEMYVHNSLDRHVNLLTFVVISAGRIVSLKWNSTY